MQFDKQNKDIGYMLQKDRALGMTVERLQSEIACETVNWKYAVAELNFIKGRVASLALRYPSIMTEYKYTSLLNSVKDLDDKVKEEHKKIEDFIKGRMDTMVTEVLSEAEAEKQAEDAMMQLEVAAEGGKDAT